MSFGAVQKRFETTSKFRNVVMANDRESSPAERAGRVSHGVPTGIREGGSFVLRYFSRDRRDGWGTPLEDDGPKRKTKDTTTNCIFTT